jgi:hypothetical protein
MQLQTIFSSPEASATMYGSARRVLAYWPFAFKVLGLAVFCWLLFEQQRVHVYAERQNRQVGTSSALWSSFA